MPETTDKNQGQQTGTATLEPEHHQTQAATGSPQAGGTSTAGTQPGGGTSTGSTSASGTPTAGGRTGGGSPSGTQTGGTGMSRISSGGGSSTGTARRGLMTPASLLGNPFGVMRSLVDEMDRFFDDFLGFGGPVRYGRPGLSSGSQSQALSRGTGAGSGLWYPQIEVSERGGNLVVCADLPGTRKEDVHLEVHDDFLVLEGERRQEQEQNEGGWYRSERSYGRFYRTIPLPEGVNPDQAKANFKDGVLEVTIPLPRREEQQQRGRSIEIE
ncbi:MAG TPA: Hsp20/alpha crystallin family protein [Thermoanaerobaculia bacterium]|jgi:HSP20 family protein